MWLQKKLVISLARHELKGEGPLSGAVVELRNETWRASLRRSLAQILRRRWRTMVNGLAGKRAPRDQGRHRPSARPKRQQLLNAAEHFGYRFRLSPLCFARVLWTRRLNARQRQL